MAQKYLFIAISFLSFYRNIVYRNVNKALLPFDIFVLNLLSQPVLYFKNRSYRRISTLRIIFYPLIFNFATKTKYTLLKVNKTFCHSIESSGSQTFFCPAHP